MAVLLDARGVIVTDQARPLFPSVIVDVARPRLIADPLRRWHRVIRIRDRVPGRELRPCVPLHEVGTLVKFLTEHRVRAVRCVSTECPCTLQPAA